MILVQPMVEILQVSRYHSNFLIPANSSLDSKSQSQQIFSKGLVESKRLGRTLPAVINGMSASQAQAQGFVEELTDAETISTDNEESLFVDGGSGDEHMQSGSESEAPRIKPIFGNGRKLDATASPFSPFGSPVLGIVPGSGPVTASQLGRSSSNPQIKISPAETSNSLAFNSGSSTQTTPAPIGTKEAPRFNPFASAIVKEKEHAKKSSDPLPGNEPSKFDFGAATKASQVSNTNNSLGFSSIAKPSGATPSVLDQPSTKPSFLFPAQQETVSNHPSATPVLKTSGSATSVFDKAPTTSTPSAFSFGTSPLFQSFTQDQKPKTQDTQLFPQQNDKMSKPSLFSTPATSDKPANFSFTSKPTVEPASASPTKGASTPGIVPTPSPSTMKEIPDSKPPQPTSFAPKHTTEGFFQPSLFQPSLGSKSSQSHLTSAKQDSNTMDLSQPKMPASSELPSPSLYTSAGTASTWSGSTAVGTISGGYLQDTKTLPAVVPDPWSSTLDQLADALMLGEKGLLQQFVEYTVGPIVESSIKQLEDEDSWEQARQSHFTLHRYYSGMLIWSRGVSCSFVKQEIF